MCRIALSHLSAYLCPGNRIVPCKVGQASVACSKHTAGAIWYLLTTAACDSRDPQYEYDLAWLVVFAVKLCHKAFSVDLYVKIIFQDRFMKYRIEKYRGTSSTSRAIVAYMQ